MRGMSGQWAAVWVLLAASYAAAADWPHWGGDAGRNMVSSETNLPETFSPGQKDTKTGAILAGTTKNIRWSAPLGSACYGNPTVAAGRVFVGVDDQSVTEDSRFERNRGGLVKAFDEATGRLLWQLVVPERKDYPKNLLFGHQHLGICSSPAVDGDCLYIVTSAAEVLCLDVRGQANGNDGPYEDEARYMVPAGRPAISLRPTDADILWRLDLINDLKVSPHDATSCSILVHGDVLYLSTSNGVDKPHTTILSPDAPAFIALDKRTGRLLATDSARISRRMFHAQWSSPSLGVVNGKTLIFVGGSDGFCYAFEALTSIPEKPVELKTAWSFDCNPPEYRIRDGKPIRYLDGDRRKKDSPNKSDGSYVGPSDIIGTPVFHNNRIYVALGQDPAHGRGRGMIHCIDATQTGDVTKTARIWSYGDMDRTICTPAVADGLVYIPDVAGRLHCLDANTGQRVWMHDAKAETWGSALVADGKVYLGTFKEFLVFAAGRELKVLNSIRLGSQICTTPIAANGTLYVASQRHLWAAASEPFSEPARAHR